MPVSMVFCKTNQVFFILKKITGWVDKGNYADKLYLDFPKAFDLIPFGMNRAPVSWIKNCLTDISKYSC